MKVTPFALVVGLIIVPFVVLPVVASVGAVLLLASYAFPLGAFFVGLGGGTGIILGIVRWLNRRAVNRPAGMRDARSNSI